MKLTLRKANALQLSILEHINVIDMSPNVQLSEFDDISNVIDTRRETVFANIDRKIVLTNAIYKLRKLVSVANHVSGIDDVLNETASIDKKLRVYTTLIQESQPMIEKSIIEAKLNKIRSRTSETTYFGNDSVASSVFSLQEIENFGKEVLALKKRKQALKDQLLELNIKSEIELDSPTVTVLKMENIL